MNTDANTTTCVICGHDFPDRDMFPLDIGGELCGQCLDSVSASIASYQDSQLAAKSAECDALRIGMDAAARNADRARAECQRLREALANLIMAVDPTDETAQSGRVPNIEPYFRTPLVLARAALQEVTP